MSHSHVPVLEFVFHLFEGIFKQITFLLFQYMNFKGCGLIFSNLKTQNKINQVLSFTVYYIILFLKYHKFRRLLQFLLYDIASRYCLSTKTKSWRQNHAFGSIRINSEQFHCSCPNSAVLIQKSFVSKSYEISIITTDCCYFLFKIHVQWVHVKVLNKEVLTDLDAVLQDITAPTCPPCTILLLKVNTCEAKQDLCSQQSVSGHALS